MVTIRFHNPEAEHGVTLYSGLCFSQDPFGEKRGCFDYQSLLVRLGATHRRIREKSLAEDTRNDNNSDSDTSSSETDLDSQGSSQP